MLSVVLQASLVHQAPWAHKREELGLGVALDSLVAHKGKPCQVLFLTLQ